MPLKSNLDMGKAPPSRTLEVPLPSGGIAYSPEKGSLDGDVSIRPYSFTTESHLVSNKKWHDKMKSVLDAITDLPEGFSSLDLLTGDAFYVFACARALTYGEVYIFPSVCPSCGHREDHSMKIPDELPVHRWFSAEKEGMSVKEGDDPNSEANVRERGGSLVTPETRFFEIELPELKDEVELKFLTLRDEQLLGDRFDQIEKHGASDTSARREIARVASHVVAVNGGTPDSAMENEDYISRIEGADMVKLYDAIRDKACGINFSGEVDCEKCGFVYLHEVPLRKEFFRRSRG